MRLCLALIFLLAAHALQALELPKNMQPDEPVRIRKHFFGPKYRQGEDSRPLKIGSVQKIVGRYPEARPDVIASKVWLYAGATAGGAGGFLVGYSVSRSFGDDKLNQPMLYSGVGLIAVSILFSKFSESRLIQAVEKYNAALPAKVGVDWNYAPERSSVALQVRF